MVEGKEEVADLE